MNTTECIHCQGGGELGTSPWDEGPDDRVPIGQNFVCAWCNGSGLHVEWPDEIWKVGERQQGPISYSGNTITTAVERTALAFMRVLGENGIPHLCYKDPNHNTPRFRIVIQTERAPMVGVTEWDD